MQVEFTIIADIQIQFDITRYSQQYYNLDKHDSPFSKLCLLSLLLGYFISLLQLRIRRNQFFSVNNFATWKTFQCANINFQIVRHFQSKIKCKSNTCTWVVVKNVNLFVTFSRQCKYRLKWIAFIIRTTLV